MILCFVNSSEDGNLMVEKGSLTLDVLSSVLHWLSIETHEELGNRLDYCSSRAGVSVIRINIS